MTSNVALLLSAIDRHLLDDYQHNFPLDPQPFATIAEELGTDEAKSSSAWNTCSASAR